MLIGFSLKGCGKAHPHCHICRPDVAKNMQRSAGWSKGMTYEQMYGSEKAAILKAQRAWPIKGQPGPCTEKRRRNISLALKGLKRSAAHCAAISVSRKGKNYTSREKRQAIVRKHNSLDLPNCRCYVHGAARPYMVSSYTWKLTSSLVALGFDKVIPEAQFGKKRVDALLADEWLAFEADGNYHFTKERREYDAQRDAGLLERFDLPVVRLSGDEVQRLYDAVVA